MASPGLPCPADAVSLESCAERFAVFNSIIAFANDRILDFTEVWPEGTLLSYEWNVKGMLAVLFVCLICGAMGALVVGNRMAFFSDALAHCAFAGVALGIALFLLFDTDPALFREQVTIVMVVFGIVIGLLISFVRERTGLASDTVIGVFYAAAMGLGAIFTRLVTGPQLLNLEQFIFGDPVLTSTGEVLCLGVLAVGVVACMWWMHNYLV